MVEPVIPYEPYISDMDKIVELVSSGISIGIIATFLTALTGFFIAKIIKLMMGRG